MIESDLSNQSVSFARIRRTEMVEALQHILRWMSLNADIGIERDIALVLRENEVRLYSATGTSFFERILPADQVKNGDVSVSPQKMLRICKSMEEEFIEVGFNQPPVLTIIDDVCTFRIGCGRIENVQSVQRKEMTHAARFNGQTLHEGLKKIMPCMTKNLRRYGINAMHVDVIEGHQADNPKMLFVATDGHRMGTFRHGCRLDEAVAEKMDIEWSTAHTLHSILGSREEWTMMWGDTHIQWKSHDMCMQCPKDEHGFPEYRTVIPSMNDRSDPICVDRRNLMKAIRRSMAVSTSKVNMIFDVRGNKLEVRTSTNLHDRFKQDLHLSKERDETSVLFGVDGSYLMDIARHLKRRDLQISAMTPLSPLRIDEDHVTIIVMPRRMDSL